MALPWCGAFASRRRVSAAGACSTVLVRARGPAEDVSFQSIDSHRSILLGKLHIFGQRQPQSLCLNQMHDSKPVRLLITLNGTRHLSVHDAHAPATRLRRPARVHELTIAAGSDSSSTFVRRDGGVAAPDAKRVLKCHPESVRLRRPPAAKRLATGSAQSPAWRPSCRVASRPSPRPTAGAVCDEVTASA